MAEFIKAQFDMGFFTAEDVQSFVPMFITQEEADAIVKGGESMKINDNGIVRDMTPAEVKEMEERLSQMPPPSSEPTVADLTKKVDGIAAAVKEF